jgi:hypothetical protein
MVPAKTAWVLQESPSALVPLLVILMAPVVLLDAMPLQARLTASAFMTHYMHRAFVYPLMTRPSKQTPFMPALLAFLFCIFNGAMQVCSSELCSTALVYPLG